jgi:tRNA1Val (adenine37-N6)-methyltransferase
LVLPTEEGKQFIKEAEKEQLFLIKKTNVFPKPNYPSKRLMMTFSKQKPNEIQEDDLIIENEGRHNYSAQYISLTKDFYIIF